MVYPQTPPDPGYRHIYLVSQCYTPGRSHWYMWIPSLQDPKIGRIIHVKGSVLRGFSVELEDNHDLTCFDHVNHFTHLGQVRAELVVDADVPDNQPSIREEGDVRDDFDIAAYALELPRRDLTRPPECQDDPIWNRPHPRFERCQEWTRRLIADLVADKNLPRTALQLMDTAISYTDDTNTPYAYNSFAPPYNG